MIQEELKQQLEEIKPYGYAELVLKELEKCGLTYSRKTIFAVYAGDRENLEIETAIVKVFKREDRKKKIRLEKLTQQLAS